MVLKFTQLKLIKENLDRTRLTETKLGESKITTNNYIFMKTQLNIKHTHK